MTRSFIRHIDVPAGQSVTFPATTVRYVGGEYVETPFDPDDETQQVYRPAARPLFLWEHGA